MIDRKTLDKYDIFSRFREIYMNDLSISLHFNSPGYPPHRLKTEDEILQMIADEDAHSDWLRAMTVEEREAYDKKLRLDYARSWTKMMRAS